MLWMKPLTQTKPAPVSKVPAKPPAPHPRLTPRQTPQQQVAQVAQTPPPPPPLPELPTITTTPPPEPDMAADLAKRRKLREQAQSTAAPQESQAVEDDNQRGLARAQDNLANLQARAGHAGHTQHGGVFKLDRVSYHRAEYTFNGWNKNFKRQMPTRIEVELGNEGDIETAIVNSMIALIRKERSAEFSWESHRLGRVVELNARPEFTAELQAFLMREFFPEHRPVPRQATRH